MGEWALALSTAPAVEPVSSAEAKLHLRVDIATDDTLIGTVIKAARRAVERESLHALISQTWTMKFDQFPAEDILTIPLAPLQSVTSVVYTDEDGNDSTVAATVHAVDTDSVPGRIYLKPDQSWPGDTLYTHHGVTITFVAGFGDASTDVPEDLLAAVKIMIAHLYENRELVMTGAGANVIQVPLSVEWLCADYRAKARRY